MHMSNTSKRGVLFFGKAKGGNYSRGGAVVFMGVVFDRMANIWQEIDDDEALSIVIMTLKKKFLLTHISIIA